MEVNKLGKLCQNGDILCSACKMCILFRFRNVRRLIGIVTYSVGRDIQEIGVSIGISSLKTRKANTWERLWFKMQLLFHVFIWHARGSYKFLQAASVSTKLPSQCWVISSLKLWRSWKNFKARGSRFWRRWLCQNCSWLKKFMNTSRVPNETLKISSVTWSEPKYEVAIPSRWLRSCYS